MEVLKFYSKALYFAAFLDLRFEPDEIFKPRFLGEQVFDIMMFPSLSPSSSITPARLAEGRVRIKVNGSHLFLSATTIPWIEAAGNYVRVWVENAGEPYIVKDTMLSMQNRLDPSVFVRIHRSLFVNRHRIRELRPWYTGEYIVILDSGKELMLSRGYRRNLPDLLAIADLPVRPDQHAGTTAEELSRPGSKKDSGGVMVQCRRREN